MKSEMVNLRGSFDSTLTLTCPFAMRLGFCVKKPSFDPKKATKKHTGTFETPGTS